MTIAWSFQTVHHDLWDYDVASPPLLFDSANGPAVAVGSKTGHLFLFDRLSGKPIFPIGERPVPPSDIPANGLRRHNRFPLGRRASCRSGFVKRICGG